MLVAFGSGAAAGPAVWWNNSIFALLAILVAIFIFIKFCSWAKKFQLSAGFKKIIFILTGVGLIVFNVLYSLGNKTFAASHNQDLSMATIALASAMVWTFIFAFTLMAETKSE